MVIKMVTNLRNASRRENFGAADARVVRDVGDTILLRTSAPSRIRNRVLLGMNCRLLVIVPHARDMRRARQESIIAGGDEPIFGVNLADDNAADMKALAGRSRGDK